MWKNSTERYGSISIGLHWLMLVLMVAVYATIELREFYPKGSDQCEALKVWHFMLGLSIFGLVWLRLLMRIIAPTLAGADAPPPATDDPVGHGTAEVANIFACAPDAQVFGVKMGGNAVLSFDRAMAIAPGVISCSWGYHLTAVTTWCLRRWCPCGCESCRWWRRASRWSSRLGTGR